MKLALAPLALVRSFANTTVVHGYHLLEDVGGMTAWLFEHGFPGEGVRLDEADRRLAALRECKRGLDRFGRRGLLREGG